MLKKLLVVILVLLLSSIMCTCNNVDYPEDELEIIDYR